MVLKEEDPALCVAKFCYFYEPSSYLCFNDMRFSHWSDANCGVSREAKTSPVSG
jgi:hypothetical protein